MRWLFADPDDRREAAARKRVLATIDRWWEAFEGKTAALAALFGGKKPWDLPGWMHDTLQAIDPHLCWEFGPAVKTEGHRLVITPEFRHHLRPLVRTVLDRAPDLPGWEFYPYRLAEDVEEARATVEGRTGGTLDGLTCELQIGDGHRIDLLYRSPTARGDNDEDAVNVAFVASESLLGERALDRWVGAIEAKPTKAGGRGVPPDRLKERFDALVDSIRDRLPARPFVEQSAEGEWSLLRLEPEEADDYPGTADLLTAVVRDVELWKATHGGVPFYSARFSRCRETFAYVKVDGSHFRRGKEADDRGEIEDALDAALARDGLGVHVGGGTGLRYSYIDLALTDLDRAVEVTRKTLRKLKVPERTWVLFFDADLGAEWVGVYPETPEPPPEAEEE